MVKDNPLFCYNYKRMNYVKITHSTYYLSSMRFPIMN